MSQLGGMNGSGYTGIPEVLVTRTAAAIRPIDPLLAGGVPIGAVEITMDGAIRPPVRNRSGWYVYSGLPDGSYSVHIRSDYYMDETITISLSAAQGVAAADVPLLPKANYPFAGHMTLIRGHVLLPNHEPCAGAELQAVLYEPQSSYLASLAEPIDPGTARIKLTGPSVSEVSEGQILLIKNANASKVEYARIASPVPANPLTVGFTTTEQLRFAHQAGTLVYGAEPSMTFRTRTSDKGEFALAVTNLPIGRGYVALTIAQSGYRLERRDIQCDEGRTTSIGILTLLSS